MLLVFVAVCGNAAFSSGASDITLPAGSEDQDTRVCKRVLVTGLDTVKC